MGDPISHVVTPVIEAIIKEAVSLIKTEFMVVYGVNEDVEKLSSSLTTIQAVLEDAEVKQLKDQALNDWLGKLKDAAYDAEDILDLFRTEAHLWKRKQQVRTVPRPISASKTSYQSHVAHKIKEISTRLDLIAQEKQKFHLDVKPDGGGGGGGRPNTGDRPLHTTHFLDKTVVGREVDTEKIIEVLVASDDTEADISVIPIIGMGGLGKTTLAQLVYNNEKVKDHFGLKMWVSVTVDFDLTRILKEMIEKHSEMTYDLNVLSETQLRSRLLEFLARKRFFLVLDDVWIDNYEEWEPLLMLLKHGGKGSKVLVTSRNTKVSDIMGTKPPYFLSYLPYDECWSLFQKIAFKEGNQAGGARKDLEDIGREIVRKCEGLPLAVRAMAGLLRGNVDVNKWSRILKHDIWEVEQNFKTGKPIISPALKLSYYHLPSYLKQCFAYCSIFPKAYEFDKNELVKLWMAEAFIQSRGRERTEETGSDYFDELLMRSFFLHSNVDNKERYRMHDLIHDLAQTISRPQCCQVKDNAPSLISEKSRHVSLLCKDVEQSALEIIDKSKKLRALLLPGDQYSKTLGQALDKMFRTLTYIRVLDLSSTTLLELPKSIEELKLLRYLDLSKTEIRMLPNSICNLYNLQTLKLLGCLWLFELPKDLGNLVNLRHLELDEMFWYKSSMLPPKIGSLTSLHNLHAFQVGHRSEYGIGELKDMAYLTGTLHISKLENAVNAEEAKLKDKESLHKVVFEWSNGDGQHPRDEAADERVLEDLQPHSNLKELQICHYRGTGFPPWMRDGLIRNLVTVSLNHCTKCKVLSLGQLPHLGQLYIKGMQELEAWGEVQCKTLYRLKISNCPKLRELPPIFPNLGVLKIKKCDSLKALPVTPSLKFLILIDNLVLENWHETVVQCISVNNQGQLVTQHRPSFVDLLELKIISCPKLQALPQIFFPQKLVISGCELLSTLPVPERARRLQHLALDACHDGTLVRAIPDTCSSLYSLVISNISNIISFPRWPHLPGLKALYIRGCSHLVSLSEEEASLQGLTSLKLLSIRDCSKLVTLTNIGLPTALECLSIGSCPSLKSLGPKEILKSLTSLKDLYIEDCPALQSLPEEGLSTSLQHLHIQRCPLLMPQCQEDGGDWPKIMHIPDQEIDSTKLPPAPDSTKIMKAAWYHHFRCCRGIDIREIGQPQEQPNSHGLMQRDKGQNSKGKMVPAEPSSSQ